MQEMIDEAGNVWLVDAEGNPVRLVRQAEQGPPADPAFPFEGAKAEAEAQRAQNQADASALDPALAAARINQANAAAASSAASAAKTRGDEGRAQAAFDAEQQEKSEGAAAEARERFDRVVEGLTNIVALRKIIKEKPLASGSIVGQEGFIAGDDYFGASAFLNQDVNDAFAMQQTIVGDLIRRSRSSGDQAITGKEADTPREAERIAAAIANVSLTQSEGAITTQLDRAFDFYIRRFTEAKADIRENGGEVPADVSDVFAARGVEMPKAVSDVLSEDTPPPVSRTQPGQLQTELAQGERYSTPEDFAVAEAVQGVYNSGGSLRDMIEVSESMGRPVDLRRSQEFARAIDYRDATGEYEGQRTGFSTVQPAKSGQRSFLGQIYGDFARSDAGSSLVGAGIGAANAVTFGGLDEIAGSIDAAFYGRDTGLAIDFANRAKQGAADAAPGSYLAGELIGGIGMGVTAAGAFPNAARVLAGSGRRALATGAALGGVTGALENNRDRAFGGVAGAGLGAAGGVVGEKVIAPGVERLTATRGFQGALNSLAGAANRVLPETRQIAPQSIDTLSPELMETARALRGTNAIGNLREARSLGLPYSLADADPQLRALAGSVSRQSQGARGLAEETFDPRGLDQAARARSAVNENFAPILEDPSQRARELTQAGSMASDPFYQQTYRTPAPDSEELRAMLDTQAGRAALKDARTIAENEGRNPDELGFVLDEGGNVTLPGMDGRFSSVAVGDPTAGLTSRTLTGLNGPVNLRGPIDMVTWLRAQGGLRESGGELRGMGLTNQGRSGVDFVGQEARLGPLVNDEGMNFDDAALAAWEAGYFPELSSRPSVNEFLDALRGTYEGRQRRFLPEDMPEVERYGQAVQQRDAAREARFAEAPLTVDNSTPAGPRDFAPLDAYGREVRRPTVETLDYVKRALDQQVSAATEKNPITGAPVSGQSPIARSLEQLRKRFVDEVDRQVPTYKSARAEAKPYIRAREALGRGQAAVGSRAKARDVAKSLEEMTDLELENYRSGFATGLGDLIDNQNLSGDPFTRIYGSTSARNKAAALFPDGVERFGRINQFERDMARTRQEVLGGSPTATRLAADEQFASNALKIAADGVTDAVATGGVLTSGNVGRLGANALRDRMRLGFGGMAERRADRLAPTLFDTAGDLDYLDAIEAYNRQRAARRAAARPYGALFGASAPIALIPAE